MTSTTLLAILSLPAAFLAAYARLLHERVVLLEIGHRENKLAIQAQAPVIVVEKEVTNVDYTSVKSVLSQGVAFFTSLGHPGETAISLASAAVQALLDSKYPNAAADPNFVSDVAASVAVDIALIQRGNAIFDFTTAA